MNSGSMHKDGPYSWVVLFAIIICNMAAPGHLFSTIGILTSEYTEVLKIEPANSAIVGSVLSGALLFTVPISEVLIKYFTCRKVAAVGCILANLGFLSSAFATELWHLILGYSIMSGFGFSLIGMSAMAIVPHHFHKRQNMAYTSAGVGSGIAFTTYPYIYSSIRENFSYQNTVLLMVPLMMTSFIGPLAFKSQLDEAKPSSVRCLIKDYAKCFKNIAGIANLINSTCWMGGHIGIVVLLFSYVSGNNGSEAATLTQTLTGIMGLIGSTVLTLILIKVKLNHYILQLVCNSIAAVLCLILALTTNAYAGYITASVIGFLYSVTICNIACVCTHFFSPAQVNSMFSLANVFGAVGSFIFPALAGYIRATFSDKAALIFLSMTLFFGALTFVVAGIIRRSLWTSVKDSLPTVTNIESNQPSEKELEKFENADYINANSSDDYEKSSYMTSCSDPESITHTVVETESNTNIKLEKLSNDNSGCNECEKS